MSQAPQQLSKLVDVLDRRVERLTRAAAEAAASVTQVEHQIRRLTDLSACVTLHPLAGAAQRANAADFRDNLMRVAHACHDELGVREARSQVAKAELLSAAQRQKVMATVRDRAVLRAAAHREKAEQKVQDELAGQVWLRAGLQRPA